MGCRSRHLFLCAIFLLAVACGSEDTGGNEGNDWDLSDDAGLNDVDDNLGDPDADEDVDEDTDEPIDDPVGVVPEAFVGQTWYAVVRITDDPAIAGLYTGVEFVDDENIRVHSNIVRDGKWTILGNDDLHLYDIEPAPGQSEPEQWVLQPQLEDEKVVAIEAALPETHIAPYRLRFEPPGDASIDYSELEGRWQATQTVTNEDGATFYLASRFNDNGIVEYGIVGEEDNFIGFLNGSGDTHTYGTGETFWTLIPGSASDGHPIAGEVREIDGEYRIYFFAETVVDHGDDDQNGQNGPGDNPGQTPGDDPETELIVIEFEPVDQFTSNPSDD